MKKLLLMFVMTLVGLVAFAQDPIVSITTVAANQKSGVSSYTASWILGAPESSETWTVENFNNNNSNESWDCMRCGRDGKVCGYNHHRLCHLCLCKQSRCQHDSFH